MVFFERSFFEWPFLLLILKEEAAFHEHYSD